MTVVHSNSVTVAGQTFNLSVAFYIEFVLRKVKNGLLSFFFFLFVCSNTYTQKFPDLLKSTVQAYFPFILSPTYLDTNYFLIKAGPIL